MNQTEEFSKFPANLVENANDTVIQRRLPRRVVLQALGLGMGGLVGCTPPKRPRATAEIKTSGTPHPDTQLGFALPNGTPTWESPALPVPLATDEQPIASDEERLKSHRVYDDLQLPEGFVYSLVATFGDRFSNTIGNQFYFGTNCDYTGMVPIPGRPGEFWLFVNHEDLAPLPWLEACREDDRRFAKELKVEQGASGPVMRLGNEPIKPSINFKEDVLAPGAKKKLAGLAAEALNDLGISVIHVKRVEGGAIEAVRDSRYNFRITTISHRKPGRGLKAIKLTGPTSQIISEPLPGTFGNCSGGTTPWGTFLTCEENIQNHVDVDVDAAGNPYDEEDRVMHWRPASKGNPKGQLPDALFGLGHALEAPLDGRHYGWVCEVDPGSGRMRKHSLLGRFRHENAALRCEPNRPLAVYMGDDRRGGHVWKFVSNKRVVSPSHPGNSELMTQGILYAARMERGGAGRWLPLVPETPLVKPEPQHCQRGVLQLPNRPGGGLVEVVAPHSERKGMTPEAWVSSIETFTGKSFNRCTLGDLVAPGSNRERKLGVLLLDAYAMANAIGATPTARPEDLEIHPQNRQVFIAFTDATGNHKGSPDTRIFPDSHGTNSRQYGAIYRLQEEDDRPAALGFSWDVFIRSGEVYEGGGGFVCPDNLAFDPHGHLWMVNDISASSLNLSIDREQGTKRQPGGSHFRGVFGNSAMFMIPTWGPQQGKAFCFAVGPMESEFTGLTFTPDGQAVILSVQHPGERYGTRVGTRADEIRSISVADRSGTTFEQLRQVPLGSNFPSGELGKAPRSAVVCIRRVTGRNKG